MQEDCKWSSGNKLGAGEANWCTLMYSPVENVLTLKHALICIDYAF